MTLGHGVKGGKQYTLGGQYGGDSSDQSKIIPWKGDPKDYLFKGHLPLLSGVLNCLKMLIFLDRKVIHTVFYQSLIPQGESIHLVTSS